ncbi:EamA family transporter [Bacillus inaquosorum]|uniref:DMT family transporter n=1 Tax=Bacillus inaquosorum TaxID=483913 RepID=A0A9Q4EQM9_9BACI|nr:DMT family transporter [Bacillus inaquosorum]PPA36231.1 EamA family transporter [Bacillus subtilis]AMA51211.1 multidrug DMT transporter permease [Bacillus inaquosorum]MBT2193253.1 EamA family transporter [Bacillus inaquosorum]MBT3119808.1 DMT family transporter [Bacillus inaquosorum]MBT3124185.1 DMT family transporter [Bacillus inaquosorum]
MKSWHYGLIVFLGGCCYGILSTFVKLAYSAGYSVTEVTGGQYLFGTLMVWILVLFTKKRKVTRSQTIKLLLSGIPFGLTGGFYYQSLQSLHASLAIILLFQFVWIGTCFEWMFYKKKPTKGKIISIAILLVGSILAAGIISAKGMNMSWQGIVWGLLASLTFSTFILLSGSVGKNTPPLLKSALLSTGGLVVVFLLFPPIYLFDLPVLKGVAPYGLLLGFFGVVLPPLLFTIGMPHVGPGLGTILTASELPVAVSMAALVLEEHVSIVRWMGVILILGGIAVGNVRVKAKLDSGQAQRDSSSQHS